MKSAMGAAIALVRGQIALVQADGEQGSVVNHGVPNAQVNRRLPAKLVDVLLNDQLGRRAKARCCTS